MKKMMTFMISLILICGISIPAFAASSGTVTQGQAKKQIQSQTDQIQDDTQDDTQNDTQDETQDKTKNQTRDRSQDQSCQTEISEADREQARLQVRVKIKISEHAKIKYKERLQQSQNQSCFSDTEQHWAKVQINAAYCWGLINGYPDGEFNPDGNISGTEGVLMVSRLMNCLDGEDDSETDESTIDGEDDSETDESIIDGEDNSETDESSIDWNLVPEWAKEQFKEKITLRIAEQCQCYGEQKLNRLQFTIMMAKAVGIEPEEVSADTVAFLDQSEISDEDLGYIEALRTLGIIEGDDGCFYASHDVTRAEAAAILTRMLEITE